METMPKLGCVAAWQRTDQWFEVRLTFEGENQNSEALEALMAVAHAFGFLLGRRVQFLTIEEDIPGQERRDLFVPYFEPTKRAILAPLASAYLSGAETLLARAVDFFLTEGGRRAVEHLSLCWDAADSQLATQVAEASICLEGLLRHASPPSKKEKSTIEGERLALEKLLDDNRDKFGPTFIKRILGVVSGFDVRRPIDVLHDWKKRGLLGVTDEDIEAWKEARNSAAHARLIGPIADKELQTMLSQFFRELDLINRIVLPLPTRGSATRGEHERR
jgi:hypothetical protein